MIVVEARDIADLRQKLAAATPGPWEAGHRWVYTMPIYPDDPSLMNVFGVRYADEERMEAEAARGLANTELIVAAVNALPVLLDEIERLRAATDLHEPMKVWESDRSYTLVCRQCSLQAWPCPTAFALESGEVS